MLVGFVCLSVWSVCLSVKSHLIRPENAVTYLYSAGNEGENICGIFSETTLLQSSSTSHIVLPIVGHFLLCAKTRKRYHDGAWGIRSLAEGVAS